MQNLSTELEGAALDAIIDGLMQGLSESAVVTMKAQNYHWNVTGMSFGSLHELFQEIYEDHFKAQDDLAERIKSLDGHVEGRLVEHVRRSKVEECDGRIPAEAMVAKLAGDEALLGRTMIALAEVASRYGDTLTEDLAIARGQVHEKFAWLLRAHIK
ncbi:MAG: DNA starvation/stationary phase protection protein [Pseudomonadota bacterium]